MTARSSRRSPLDPVHPVVFIDAIHVKIRDGAVADRPIDVVLAVFLLLGGAAFLGAGVLIVLTG